MPCVRAYAECSTGIVLFTKQRVHFNIKMYIRKILIMASLQLGGGDQRCHNIVGVTYCHLLLFLPIKKSEQICLENVVLYFIHSIRILLY